jgi:DNA invertase Pin-like site-specific DNA recombinase
MPERRAAKGTASMPAGRRRGGRAEQQAPGSHREIIQPLREKQALISRRTRQALSAAKARGVSLGNPTLHVARKNAVGAVKAEADRYAANVLPIIREAQKAGARTLREIAEALNARGIATARDGQWYAQSVANILERA